MKRTLPFMSNITMVELGFDDDGTDANATGSEHREPRRTPKSKPKKPRYKHFECYNGTL